jgi:hypothetical protein
VPNANGGATSPVVRRARIRRDAPSRGTETTAWREVVDGRSRSSPHRNPTRSVAPGLPPSLFYISRKPLQGKELRCRNFACFFVHYPSGTPGFPGVSERPSRGDSRCVEQRGLPPWDAAVVGAPGRRMGDRGRGESWNGSLHARKKGMWGERRRGRTDPQACLIQIGSHSRPSRGAIDVKWVRLEEKLD